MSETEYALARHCGATFAGIKPASLFRMDAASASLLPYYAGCFAKKGFSFVAVQRGDSGILLYVYHEARLRETLFHPAHRAFLRKRGYRYRSAQEAVEELKRRMAAENFPHEIGIFLGYPLEDVEGFIRHPREGVQLTGCWKVYANVPEKEKQFARMKKCEACICSKLERGEPLTAIFRIV